MKKKKVKATKKVKKVSPKKTSPKKRHRPDIEEHIGHYKELLELIDIEIDKRSRGKGKGIRILKLVKKRLIKMKKEVPIIVRRRVNRKGKRDPASNGLTMEMSISDELLEFLGLPEDSTLSRLDGTRAVDVYAHLKENEDREGMLKWAYLNPDCKRDLQNPMDRKAIVPDKTLSKLLKYKKYQRQVANGEITKKMRDKETGIISIVPVTSDALYYWVVPKLLGVHFLKIEDFEIRGK